MTILGIHQGHDSSAALLVDGKIVADVQEERFNRVKHSSDIPINSILYCLKEGGLSNINEVDKVSFSWLNSPSSLSALLGIRNNSMKSKILKMGMSYLGIKGQKPPIYYPDLKLLDQSKFVCHEHHLMHAASAYYTRKTNDRCLIFTIDGAGDNVSTAVWIGEGNSITPLQKLNGYDAGIGWAYSIVTEGLHWIHGDGEGKTMGLAPYGNADICKGVLDKYFPVFRGTQLVKKSAIGNNNNWQERGSSQFHFDDAYEVEKLINQYGKENVAAEAQRKIEEVAIEYIKGWCIKTGIKKIAAAGGVFLNVKMNQRVWEKRDGLIDDFHVYPNPADSGLAVGAALFEYYKTNEFKGTDFSHLYLGPSYSDDYIRKVLTLQKLTFREIADPAVTAAKYLSENKIVAWFQGRMESGPRALGNRSILMSPIHPENKRIINEYVKFRENFRPFCPSMLYEKADEYMINHKEELFMITSYMANSKNREKIPAVVHQDGTLRPQMVKKEINPLYWNLINEFGKLTGEYILLNTSFNVMGEPIINTPEEAVRGFYSSGIDALFLGKYLLVKDSSLLSELGS